MDTMPVLFHGKKSGEARLERQALYTTVHVRCTARSGLWYAWAVGEEGEARIGILEPAHGEMSTLAPLGRLRRIELRPARESSAALPGESPAAKSPASAQASPWQPCAETWTFPDAFLRRQWQERRREGVREVLTQQADGKQYLAFPRTPSGPFPLPGLFCFARSAVIDGRDYWVFTFNPRQWPVMNLPSANGR